MLRLVRWKIAVPVVVCVVGCLSVAYRLARPEIVQPSDPLLEEGTAAHASVIRPWLESSLPADGDSKSIESRDIKTANPNATIASKRVLRYLSDLPKGQSKRVISGQCIGHGQEAKVGYFSYVTELAKRTKNGLRPAMLGADYGWDTMEPADVQAVNLALLHHWRRGGLVELHCHSGSPFYPDGKVQETRLPLDLAELLKPGSEHHARWRRDLDVIAAGLRELQDAGVVVLWRPFHEMNGGWFWWCTKSGDGTWTSKETFVSLWKDMFHYFTYEKKLNNLLWVYSPNAQLTDEIRPTDYYYPGNEFVDIVGYDLYYWKPLGPEVFDLHGSYSRLAQFGKPFGICEFGPGRSLRNGSFDNRSLIENLKTHCPNACYFMFWSSWQSDLVFYSWKNHVAMVDNQNADALLSDPWVITRDEIGE